MDSWLDKERRKEIGRDWERDEQIIRFAHKPHHIAHSFSLNICKRKIELCAPQF